MYSTECRVSENSKERQEGLLNEQCKEVEENNRIGKTRDFFKKIGEIKGTFHARMGAVKDLTEAGEMKKRWQKYTEELYKKGLNDQNNHEGVCGHSPRARHPEV